MWNFVIPAAASCLGQGSFFCRTMIENERHCRLCNTHSRRPPKQTNQNKNSPDRELLKKVLKIVIKMLKYIDFHKWWVFVWGRGLNNKKSFSYIIIKTIYMQNEERILTATQVIGLVTYKCRPVRIHLTFQWKQCKPEGPGWALWRH